MFLKEIRVSHRMRYGIMLFAFILLFLAATLVYSTQEIWALAFGLVISIFAVVLIFVYGRTKFS